MQNNNSGIGSLAAVGLGFGLAMFMAGGLSLLDGTHVVVAKGFMYTGIGLLVVSPLGFLAYYGFTVWKKEKDEKISNIYPSIPKW